MDILIKRDLNVATVREHKKKRRDRYCLIAPIQTLPSPPPLGLFLLI